MNSKVTLIINEWDIDNKEIKQISDCVWQIGEAFVLKAYKDADILQKNIMILTVLEAMDIPVGGIVLTKEKKTYVKDNEYCYILTNKLSSGSSITEIFTVNSIAPEMGRALARLHKAFKECEVHCEFCDNSLLKELNGWIKTAFIKNNWEYIEESAFCDLTYMLESLYDKLPVQLIHRDVHPGNFLFDNGNFSGYIDFDLSQRNIRIFDLCYFMLGLLSDEKVQDIAKEKWFVILTLFFTGYEQENELLQEEKQAVPYVMKAIELLFAAWFLQQGDIKSAKRAMKIYRFAENNTERILKVIDQKRQTTEAALNNMNA